MIEGLADDGGGKIRLETTPSSYRLGSTVAPETGGEAVTITTAGPVTVDGRGLGDIFDFSAAGNITLLGPLTIRGDPGDGIAYSVRAGDDFTFRDLVLEGGQGGLNCSYENVTGRNLTFRNHHYPEKGWSAGVHGGEAANNVRLEGIIGERSDRGIEFENGATNVHVTDGELTDIDNARAEDPGSVFVLDVHSHPDRPLTENITYERFTLRNCARGLTLQGRHEDGHARDLTARDVTVVDCGDGPANPAVLVRDAQNVLVENLVLDTEDEGGLYQGTPRLVGVGSRASGAAVETEVTFRNLEVRASAKWDAIYPTGAVVTIEGATIRNPAGNTGRGIYVTSGSPLRHLSVSDLKLEDDGYQAAVQVDDDAIQSGPEHEWGAVFRNCALDHGLVVKGSNARMLVEGSTDEGHEISDGTEVVFR
jgi:hypothetical protein